MPDRDPQPRAFTADRSLAPQWLLRPSTHFGTAAPLPLAPAPGPSRRPPRTWRSKQQVSAPVAMASAWIGLIAAIALPIAAWHSDVASVASRFRFDVGYLVTGWSGYLLLVLGICAMVPAAISAGRPADRRPLHRTAYLSWGIVLYLLGLALASQVAAITG